MSKHTKGPWKQGDYILWPAPGEKAQYPIHATKRGRIALAGRFDDARLIAAAPDLLAVLQELEKSSRYWSEYDVPLGIVDRISAAIAKATGEKA